MERTEINKLLDTTPQHCRESRTGRRSEWVLLQIWKKKKKRPEHLSTQPFTPPATPLSPHLQFRSAKRRCAKSSRSRKGKKAPGPDFYTSLSEILYWPAGPHLHKDLQQITGAVRSPLMLQTLQYHPHPKEIQNYRTKWLQVSVLCRVCQVSHLLCPYLVCFLSLFSVIIS